MAAVFRGCTEQPKLRSAVTGIHPSVIQYIVDTEFDEHSHAMSINAFLASIGEERVNLAELRTRPNPRAVSSWCIRFKARLIGGSGRAGEQPGFASPIPRA